MTPLPAVPNVVKVKLLWTVGEDMHAVTVLHYRYSGGPPDAADLVTLGTAVNALVVSTGLSLLIATNSYDGCELLDLSSPSGAGVTVAASHVGTLGGVSLGAAVAFVCSYRIVRRYRGGKPRSYFPFGSTAVLTDAQTWTTPFDALVPSFMNAMNTALVGTGGMTITVVIQCSVSYYHGFTVTPPDPVTGRVRTIPTKRVTPLVDDVSGWLFNPRPGTQRRRTLQGH